MQPAEEPGRRRHRILIVSAAMGGGHLQISRELRRRLVERGCDVELVDLLELMPAPTGGWLGQIYPWLVERTPWLYEWIYRVFFLARQRSGERTGVPVRLALPGLRRVVNAFRPDVTVSTYHLAALAVGRLRAAGVPTGTVVTMITQFAVHDVWLHPSTDLELCISEPAAEETRARTGRPAQVVGPVVRPEFGDQGDAAARVRAELGVPAATRLALVVTGSLGMGGSSAAAVAAVARLPDWTPVVVCGRNDELHNRLATDPHATDGDRVVLGWVDDMAALMAACDVLVDNAGGMSSKEALAAGLPVVTFRPIPGHGRHDAEELARLGLSDVVDDEAALVAALDRLAGDPAVYWDRVERGRTLFVADAAEVVTSLCGARTAFERSHRGFNRSPMTHPLAVHGDGWRSGRSSGPTGIRLDGASALVTGASSGIGAALATRLAAAGCRPVLLGRDEEALNNVVRATGGRAIVADLTTPDGLARGCAAASEVDLLVNNAGRGWAGELPDMSSDVLSGLVALNLEGPLHLVRAAVAGMRSRGHGHLAFISSIAMVGVRDEAVYAATKAGLRAFAASIRHEVAAAGIGVTTVLPGAVATDFFTRRGRPYDRSFPRQLTATAVADAAVRAMTRGRAEVFTPTWLAPVARLHGLAPETFYRLAHRFS